MVSVNVKNCIRYYQTAEEIGAILLRDFCSQLVSSHWVTTVTMLTVVTTVTIFVMVLLSWQIRYNSHFFGFGSSDLS